VCVCVCVCQAHVAGPAAGARALLRPALCQLVVSLVLCAGVVSLPPYAAGLCPSRLVQLGCVPLALCHMLGRVPSTDSSLSVHLVTEAN
jgi:hypothetical protein